MAKYKDEIKSFLRKLNENNTQYDLGRIYEEVEKEFSSISHIMDLTDFLVNDVGLTPQEIIDDYGQNTALLGTFSGLDYAPFSLDLSSSSIKLLYYNTFEKSNLTSINCSGVTCVGSDAFNECSKLKSVIFNNALQEIESSAFAYCEQLPYIELPNIKKLSEWTFRNCSNLTRVDCPNVEIIEKYAFLECNNLSEINCPNVKEINYNAFSGCSNLKEIYLPKLTQAWRSMDQVFESCPDITLYLSQNFLSGSIFRRVNWDNKTIDGIRFEVI